MREHPTLDQTNCESFFSQCSRIFSLNKKKHHGKKSSIARPRYKKAFYGFYLISGLLVVVLSVIL